MDSIQYRVKTPINNDTEVLRILCLYQKLQPQLMSWCYLRPNRKIKFRPFLVKEEKILILAMESQDSTQIANAVKDVISHCIHIKRNKS